MPSIQIRETLTGRFDNWNPTADESEYKILQKRINLEDGFRYQVENVQVFNDNGIIPMANEGDVIPLVMQQTFVTPYPIILNTETVAFNADMLQPTTFDQSGPFAGDNTVLYKRLDINAMQESAQLDMDALISMEFPNPNTEILKPQTWHTPHLYLTVIQAWGSVGRDNDLHMSFYIQMKKTKCGKLESMIGAYKERLEAQTRLLTDTANTIDLGSEAGRSFPSWLFGGRRSEIMINSTNVLRYFNQVAARDYQQMMSQDAFRQRYKQSTKMVAFDEPFGTGNPQDIPDWVQIFSASGVTSGPIRDFPPPTKFTGNGNTVMYDDLGNPASIVT